MSDIQRLQDKLARLSAEAEIWTGQGREIGTAADEHLISAILREIDDTVLARDLVFENKAGDLVALEVINRRVHRISRLGGTLANAPFGSLAGQFVADTDRAVLDEFKQLLVKLTDGSDHVFVRPEKLEHATDPTDIGCSADGLATIWSLNIYPPSDEDLGGKFDEVVAASIPLAIAWVTRDENGNGESGGAKEPIELLLKLSETDLSKLETLLSQGPVESCRFNCLMFPNQTPQGHGIVILRGAGKKVFLAMAPNNLEALNALWRDVNW